MIKLWLNHKVEMSVKTSTFPGGEEYVRILGKTPPEVSSISIEAFITSSTQLMRLVMLVDAAKRKYPKHKELVLYIPYLPYARQDRVCEKGESFSLKVVSDIINSLEADRVVVSDCHSDVGLALIDNVMHLTQVQGFDITPNIYNALERCDCVVAPDAGAAKKASEVSQHWGKPLVQCLKTRSSSEIIVQVLGDIKGKNVVVVDDICDGGGTFLALLEALKDRKPRKITLAVTHGIFSKGKEVLSGYDQVEAVYDWKP